MMGRAAGNESFLIKVAHVIEMLMFYTFISLEAFLWRDDEPTE